MPKVSIIVPVYKVEKYVGRCIDSILAQTFSDWELLLIDDGSPDRSGEICDEYAQKDERIKVIHKKNGGVSSARNLGLDNAQGEWTVFTDSDDFLDSNSLNIMYELTNSYNSDLYCFEYHIIKSLNRDTGLDKTELEDKTIYTLDKKSMIKKILTYQTNCGPCCKLFKTKRLREYRFDENLKIGEDLLLNLNYIIEMEEPIVCSDTCVYNYYMNPQSVMHSKNLTTEYALLSEKVSHFFNSEMSLSKEVNIFKMINLFQSYISRHKCPSYTDTKLLQEWNNDLLTKNIHLGLFQYIKNSEKAYILAWGLLNIRFIKQDVKLMLKNIIRK